MTLTPEVLARVVAVVEAEGRVLAAEFLRPQGPRGSGYKAPIDNEIEARLCVALQAIVPCTFIGEETGTTPGSLPGWRWLVDPQDGTSDFLKGYRGSAVSVGLLRGREPVLGVVCSPVSPDRGFDTVAWAEGCGPVRRNGRPVERTLAEGRLAPGTFVWASQSAASRPARYAGAVAPARFIAMPSIAYRLARVAAGDGVVALSTHNVEEYDIAAGAALVRGAGGVVLDAEGAPIVFSGEGCSKVSGCVAGTAEAARLVACHRWTDLDAQPKVAPRVSRAFPKYADAARLVQAQAQWLALFAGRPAPDGAGEAAIVLARHLAAERTVQADKLRQAVMAWRASAPPPVEGALAQSLGVPLSIASCMASLPAVAAAFDVSVAALQEAIASAADAVPLPEADAVLAVLACRSLAESGAMHPRPPEYWPDDALDLAEALLLARAGAGPVGETGADFPCNCPRAATSGS